MRMMNILMQIIKMNNSEVISPTNRYSCDKCKHVYSPWLSQQCPKCSHKFYTLNTDKYIDVPINFPYIIGKMNVTLYDLPDLSK